MRSLGARVAGLGMVAAMALVASACSTSSGADGGDSSAASGSIDAQQGAQTQDGAQESNETDELIRVTRAAMRTTSATKVVDVGPRKGGSITVELPSGAIATLTFEAGAVAARTQMSMTAFEAGDIEGVLLEPAGSWLLIPARLAFSNTDRTPAIRIGNAADGSPTFAAPTTDSTGSIVVVRLRPVVLLPVAGGTVPDAGGVAATVDPTVDEESDVDPLDGRAAEEEAEAGSEEDDGDTSGGEAAEEAGHRVDQLAPECGPDLPRAAAQALEAWRTAGSKGAPPTECARLRAAVLAQAIVEFRGAPLKPYQETVRATGTGMAIDQVADITMPAEREVSGIEQLISFMATGIEWGVAKVGGVDWPDPNVNRCSLGSIPQGSVQLETVPLPGSKIRVTLTPKHGSYPVDCGEWGVIDMDVTVWDTLGDLLGNRAGKSVVVTTTATEHVQHVMSSLKSVEGSTVRHRSDGSVTVREGQLVMNGILDLDLRYEPAT